jgi:SAM-dependent methyltransferase
MWPTTRAYSSIAPFYDCTVGAPFFLRVRDAFEKLTRRYGIRFCSAADIGCGTGLFACYLNQCWGVPVYAVDRSLDMLHQARRNCPSPGVCLLLQDIRCLALPAAVDLITANFDTLNHLKTPQDLRRAFERVAANLRPRGHFYFDILTPCQPHRHFHVYERDRCTVGSSLLREVRWDPCLRVLRMRAVHRRAESCAPVVEQITERAYSAAELGKWLAEAGFTIRGVHDEVTLRTAVDCPPRIIVLVQKAPGGSKSN